MLLGWDPNYSRYQRCVVTAFPAAAILSSWACCCPCEAEGKQWCLEKVDWVFVTLSGSTQSRFFLFAIFQSLLGSPCLCKIFVLEKVKKTPSSSCFLVSNAAVFSIVLSLFGDYAVREEHYMCKHSHLFALSETVCLTHVWEDFITHIHLHGIVQAAPYPHACAKSVKGSIDISVEHCRVWNIQCGHIEPVVPKVQTPVCLLGTKEPDDYEPRVRFQRLCLCHLKFPALGVFSFITNCHLPSQESTTPVSCVSGSKSVPAW